MPNNSPAFCPECNTATMLAEGIGHFCPNNECGRLDDLRPVPEDGMPLIPYFTIVDHTKPDEHSVLDETVQLLREELIDLRKDNARLRFMLNIDVPQEAPICMRCPLTKVPDAGN